MSTILHCDANNFYASVEIMMNPKLQGKAVAVSGNPDKRHGIILAKSNLAKSFGVKTGETLWQARQKCPDIVFVPPHYEEYVRISNKLFEIYTEYTDKVEPFGIDECWLDCTNSLKLFESGEKIADEIRERVKKEIGITVSVGVSFTKVFAKLGSDIKKPDGTTVITEENYKDTVWKLPVTDLLMVGRKTNQLFNKLNIKTIGDLAVFDVDLLKHYMGINAEKLHNYANGIETDDIRLYYNEHVPESVGNSTTTPFDLTDISEAVAVIVSLSEMVATRLRKHGLLAAGVGLGLKFNNLHYKHKSYLIGFTSNNAKDISEKAIDILNEIYDFNKDLPIRQLNVYTYKLSNENEIKQISIFDKPHEKTEKLEKTIDGLRNKYGYNIVKKGIVLAHENLCSDLIDKEFQPFKK